MAKAAKTSHRRIIPPRIAKCAEGHPLFTYLLVPVKGRKRFMQSCECEIKPLAMGKI